MHPRIGSDRGQVLKIIMSFQLASSDGERSADDIKEAHRLQRPEIK